MKSISIAFFLSSLLMAAQVSAFAPQSHIITTSSTHSNKKQNNNVLSALPFGGHELYDLHQSMSHLFDTTTVSSSLASTSCLLSDAAAAVAEAEQKEGGGWWANYLEIFKNALNLVHSTIDQPLRNAGWDQTWGVSIFLFTVSKWWLYV